MGAPSYDLAFVPDSAPATMLLGRHASSLARLLSGVGIATLAALLLGVAIGFLPRVPRRARALRRRRSRSIPPLAVLPILFIVFGLGETSKVSADRHRHRAGHGARRRQRVADIPHEQIVKAQTLGASTAGRWSARRAAADHAAAHHLRAAGARAGLDLPDLGGGDRLDRGPRLPHLPRPPLSRDGRDPALRRLDHAARLRRRPAARPRLTPALPLGAPAEGASEPDRRATSGEELWRARVLERGQSRGRARQFLSPSSAPAAAASPPSCACCSARSSRPRRDRSSTSAVPPEPTPDRGIVFQRYSVFPHLTVIENLLLAPTARSRALSGRLFGAAARRRRDEADAMLERIGLWPTPATAIRRSSPAACSSASPSPRRCSTAEDAAARRAVRRARSRHPRDMHELLDRDLARARHDRVHGHPRHRRGLQARHAPARLRQGAPRSAIPRPPMARRSPTTSKLEPASAAASPAGRGEVAALVGRARPKPPMQRRDIHEQGDVA